MKRGFVLAALVTITSSCRGCADERIPDAANARTNATTDGRDAETTIPFPPNVDARAARLDGEKYRARARVPGLAWGSFTASAWSADAVGLADVEAGARATATTPFQVASIAKTVIAVAVMQLVEEGLVSLDADVSTYVGFSVRSPRLAHGLSRPITVRHLLSHTSSIVDRAEETAAGAEVALDDFLRGYLTDAGNENAVFLDAGPGAVMRYSNIGPSLAALAVEHVTHTRFADRVKKRIFEPLGMSTAAFGARAPMPKAPALPYASRGSAFVRLGPPSHALYPVVDLFASALDLTRFGRAILRGGELDGVRILADESVSEMLRVHFDAAPEEALGWQVRRFGTARVLGHEGEDVGASTALYVDLHAGVGAVVLSNGDAFHGEDSARVQAIGEVVERLLGAARSFAPPGTTIRSSDAD